MTDLTEEERDVVLARMDRSALSRCVLNPTTYANGVIYLGINLTLASISGCPTDNHRVFWLHQRSGSALHCTALRRGLRVNTPDLLLFRPVAVSRNLRHRLHATLRYRIRNLARSDSEQPGQVFRYIPCGDRGFCLHPSHALLGGQYGRESLGCRCQTRNDELVRTVLL